MEYKSTLWDLLLGCWCLIYAGKKKKGIACFHGGGNGTPLQYSCLENFIHRGTLPAIVPRVTKSQA